MFFFYSLLICATNAACSTYNLLCNNEQSASKNTTTNITECFSNSMLDTKAKSICVEDFDVN